MQTSTNLLLTLAEDLFFGAQIITAGKQRGLVVKNASSLETARERVREGVVGIVIDLANTRLDVLAFIHEVKADARTRHVPILAYVAHVDAERRALAEAAGADFVVPRSAFQRALPEFLERHARTLQAEAQEDLGANGA